MPPGDLRGDRSIVKSDLKDEVGATLVVAPLPADAVRKPGDHKGRPLQQDNVEGPSD